MSIIPDITFEVSAELKEKFATSRSSMKLIPDLENEDEDGAVATDITAYSAWNCAWIPPLSRESGDDE